MGSPKKHFPETLKALKDGTFEGQTLDLFGCSLDDDDIKELAQVLQKRAEQKLPTITDLDLGANAFTPEGVKILSTIAGLETLRLHDNFIGDDGAVALAQAPDLRVLIVSSGGIERRGADSLAKSKLVELDISANHFDSLAAFADNKTLESLDAHDCNLGDDGLQPIWANTTLKHLGAITNGITGEGLNGSDVNTTLTSLNLGQNAITGDELKHLPNRENLESLELYSNPLGCAAVKTIAMCTGLKFLHLNRTRIGWDPHGDLSALGKLPCLSTLHLIGNELQSQHLNSLLSSNTAIKTLGLFRNQLDDDCASTIANDSILDDVDISNNKFTDLGIGIIVRGSPKIINFPGNPVTEQFREYIVSLKKRPHETSNDADPAHSHSNSSSATNPAKKIKLT